MEKSQIRRVVLLGVVALSLLLAGNYFMSTNQGPEYLLVTVPSGTQIKVEVADNPLMLHAGLAFRDSLAPGWGMLFIYEGPEFHRVTTHQYRFPVDLLWLDEARRVIFFAENVPPCVSEPCPSYGPGREKDRYVIVTKAGFIGQEHLSPGAELRFALVL